MASYPAVQLTVSVFPFFCAVDLIDAFKMAPHICCNQRSFVYGESSRNANHTMESYFLGGRGGGKQKGVTLLLSFL